MDLRCGLIDMGGTSILDMLYLFRFYSILY